MRDYSVIENIQKRDIRKKWRMTESYTQPTTYTLIYMYIKKPCLLDGTCLTKKCVVYKAIVREATSNNQETYNLTENEFKTEFNLPKSSFTLEHKRTSTTLSYHVRKLKNKNINIKWEVVKKVKPFAPSDKVCKLCLQQKFSILRPVPSLNKKMNIVCMRDDSCLAIPTIHCLTMRSQMWTENLSLERNNIG